jgi:hypothetical protein
MMVVGVVGSWGLGGKPNEIAVARYVLDQLNSGSVLAMFQRCVHSDTARQLVGRAAEALA